MRENKYNKKWVLYIYTYNIYSRYQMDLFSFIIFIVVLFLYLHITSEWKQSQDLEIYEMDFESNGQLQEVCNVKQPVLFEFKSISPQFFEKMRLDYFLEKNSVQDVNVKDIDDYMKLSSVDSILLPFQTAHSLLKSDPKAHLILEDNADFIEECSHITDYRNNLDMHLKPPMCIRTKYDFCMGSEKSYSPLKYHNHSRHYCIVSQGKIHVKMTPWKSSKYMNATHDYENYEFFSNMNPWKNQSEKIKFLEFDVHEGDILYVPPYWWYSYQYTTYDTIVCTATYNTPMNMIANAKHWALYFFQQQNIQQKTLKTLDTNDTNNVILSENSHLSEEPTDNHKDSDNNIMIEPVVEDITAPLKVLHAVPTDLNGCS